MKRPNTLRAFAGALHQHLMDLRAKLSLNGGFHIYRINSPQPGLGGEVEVVISHSMWNNLKAITMREDGSFTEPSYWSEDQI